MFTSIMKLGLLSVSVLITLCVVTRDARTADSKPPRPNIVLIMDDDLGYGDLGCFGNTSTRTPHLDKLASQGVKLTHSVAAATMCTPNRAAFMTGRYSIRSGKWHLGWSADRSDSDHHHPLNQGFDYFYGVPLTSMTDFGHPGVHVITQALPRMPFQLLVTFLVVSIAVLCHVRAHCLHLGIGVLVVLLVGLLCGVVLFSLYNAKLLNSSCSGGKGDGSTEGSFRVPGLVRWPGHFPAGLVVREPVSLMDVLPTLADLLDVSLNSYVRGGHVMDGLSMVPLLTGQEKVSPYEFLFHYCQQDVQAVTYRPRSGSRVWKLVFREPNPAVRELTLRCREVIRKKLCT